VPVWSNAWACDCSLAAITGSNSIGVINVPLGRFVLSAVPTTCLPLVHGSRTECGVSLSLITYKSNPLHLQRICRNSSEKERNKYFIDILIYLAVPVMYFVSSFQNQCIFFLFWRNSLQCVTASSVLRFLDRTQRRTTVSMTPLDEWSVRRRDFYLTIHKTLTSDRDPRPRSDLYPKSQQASGRRLML